jgi:DNA-directed RNA polymerase II subunit RPB2
MAEITQTDAWSVIDAYFDEKGLVRQQIDSFNEFVGVSLQEIIDDSGQEIINAPNQFGLGQDHSKKLRARVEFGQIWVTKPTFHEKDGQLNNSMTPQQARLRNLTYSVALYANVRIEEEEFDEELSAWRSVGKDDDEDAGDEAQRELIGKIPMMLRSDHCVLKTMELDDKGMTELGECIYDQGGYFVINGSEKVLHTRRLSYIYKIHSTGSWLRSLVLSGQFEFLSLPGFAIGPMTFCKNMWMPCCAVVLLGSRRARAHEQQPRLLLPAQG